MEESVCFASPEYLMLLGLLFFARGADFLSTYIATPHLVLEGNPIARKLGWKWGAVVNVALVFALARWPLPAIVVSTASVLVAARNFQSAWLMHTMGEHAYRDWHVNRMLETRLSLYLFCLAGNTLLIGGVGTAVMIFSQQLLIPLALGMGIVAYAVAVAVYTLLAVWRIRRAHREEFAALRRAARQRADRELSPRL